MSELGGSEWDDKGAEKASPSVRDLAEPLATDSWEEHHDQGKLDDEQDTSFARLELGASYSSGYPGLGAPEIPYEPVPEDEPPALDRTDGDQPGQEASADWNELWEELSEALETVGDTPFTGDERREKVSPALLEAQKTIRALVKLTEQQSATINSLTEQLDRASEHLGRKDWIMMAIGAGTTLVIAEMVPAAVMVPIAVKFFQTIFGLFR
jgi:ElaB/YqjD/DUF883 family membrane-anchored ribosome-binding protein